MTLNGSGMVRCREMTCGAPHPTLEGVLCERDPCVEYHRNGLEIWTDGVLSKPAMTPDPVRLAAFIRRVEDRNRHPHDREEERPNRQS